MNPTKKGREVARSGKNYELLVLRNVTASGSGITYQRAKHVNNMNTPDQALLEVRVLIQLSKCYIGASLSVQCRKR